MRPKPRGFTLVELMVVIAILGILAAIAGPAVKKYLSEHRGKPPVTQPVETPEGRGLGTGTGW